jgi:hypothetical protein
MSLNEFVEALRRTPRDWIVTTNGLLRRNGAQHAEDTITAVGHLPGLRKPDGDHFLVRDAVRSVAPALGLDPDDAFEIACASDDTPGDLGRDLLRERLLEACGNPGPPKRLKRLGPCRGVEAAPDPQTALF